MSTRILLAPFFSGVLMASAMAVPLPVGQFYISPTTKQALFPGPATATKGRKLALDFMRKELEDQGYSISASVVARFAARLKDPKTVVLNPMGDSDYVSESLFAGRLLSKRVALVANRKGIKEIGESELISALKGFCPLWPIC